MNRICTALMACLAALAFAGCASAPSASSRVPEQFRPLYSELDAGLASAQRAVDAIPAVSSATAPLRLPALYPASSVFGPASADSQKWRDLMDWLDALKALGADGVSVMISFPNLTPEAGDTAPLLDYYERLASAVRARGMKLMVETFVYPSSMGTKPAEFVRALKDSPDPKKRYLDLRLAEAVLIAERIAPDYLSLVTEPGTYERFSKISVSTGEYADWMANAVTRIKAVSGGKVRVGAGAGAWEDPAYVRAFASVPGLHYLDMHFYPLALGTEDCFAALARNISAARKAAPGIGVVIGETWLYKHGSAEKGGVYNAEAYGRNVYSFWSLLDARFLSLVDAFSRRAGVEAVAPYFPQLFFFGTEFRAGEKLPQWPACLGGEWASALSAARAGRLSPAGEAFRAMSGAGKAPAP